jgi:glycosyltransferase involved in cell wall biosynthesis
MKVVAVVPALDEAEHIGGVVRGCLPRVDRVVVIDDGSSDDTGALARAWGDRVEVLRHERPRGVGASIAEGMARARALGADAAVVLAGDGQMDPLDLPAVLAPIARGEAELVKGDRLAWPEGALAFPLQRLIGVVGLAAATRVATGLAIDDAQCGYLAVSRRALAALPWDAMWPSFGYPNDLLSHAACLGLRVGEVPVRPVYGTERSKLRVAHLPGIAFVLLRAAGRRVTSRAASGAASRAKERP